MIQLDLLDLRATNLQLKEPGLLNITRYSWFCGKDSVAEITIEKWRGDWTSCYNLLVHERYRNQGIGSQVVRFAKEKGVKHLSVDPENEIAINLYKKHGFDFTGEREGNLLRMELI